MKKASRISRLTLGLIFVAFGLNGFLHFIPLPAPTGVAGQFMGALFTSHYLVVVFALELMGGTLLLINRYVPLALLILGPIIVNILLYTVLMNPSGLVLPLIVAVKWGIEFVRVRSAFEGIFQSRIETKARQCDPNAAGRVSFHQPNPS